MSPYQIGYDKMDIADRVERRIKLHDLRLLICVIEERSMSKAAALLNTGQPAISRSIAELDHALGVRLLDRSRQGIKPTEYGRALLDGGTAVFDDLRQTVKKIEFIADPTVGEVRVGCNPFLAASFVSAAVDRLSRRYPRIVFRLVTAYTETLLRELTARNVDLLITRRFGSVADKRFDYEFLFADAYSVAAGARNPWVRRHKIELADLVDEPWVLPPPEGLLGSVATAAFRASGLDYPRATVISEPLEVRISLLATGRFISIFPDYVFRFTLGRAELRTLPVRHSMSSVPVGIVTLKNRILNPVAELFIDSAREVAKSLPKGKEGRRNVR